MSGKRNRLGIEEPVAVFGVGVEGRSVIEYLYRHQVNELSALDQAEITDLPPGVLSKWGPDYDKDLGQYATVFRSPGIRPDHPALKEVRKSGGQVTSATAFFLERCPAMVVGVTGTLGKGTTASLIAAMFEEGGFDTRLGGNIGSSPLGFLDDLNENSRVVLELSSFQCMDLKVSPAVVVVLKTTSEHLDWHVDQREYLDAKANLLAYQNDEDMAVFNADVLGSREIASGAKRKWAYSMTEPVEAGIYLKNNTLVFRDNGKFTSLPIDLDAVRLPGRFNIENIAAALLGAIAAGCNVEAACRVAEQFEGLPHRLEFVSKGQGIRFYNDSYATRPDAALGALACFREDPLALILGGSEKHANFDELAKALISHPSLIKTCLIGATKKRLAGVIESAGARKFNIAEYADLDAAVEGAVAALGSEGVVLLSPACASFGLFPNYKVRGEKFRMIASKWVERLGR